MWDIAAVMRLDLAAWASSWTGTESAILLVVFGVVHVEPDGQNGCNNVVLEIIDLRERFSQISQGARGPDFRAFYWPMLGAKSIEVVRVPDPKKKGSVSQYSNR